MKQPIFVHVRAHPRLIASAFVGLPAALIAPGTLTPVARGLLGWNVAVWLYLLLALTAMWRADHERMRQAALAQAESAGTVLSLVVLAALASLIGIVVELSAAKQTGAAHALPHLALALFTVVGSWLLLPTLFAMTYASLYYRAPHGAGLNFPTADNDFKPDYGDFLYFSFTIAVASQTADVSVSTSPLRRLVLMHAVLSFAFNTAILAFTINIAASMF